MNQIETVFSESGRFHDRYFGETFTLPNDFETIKIQPNELVSYRVINDAFSRLYDNFMYIYGLTKVSSNILPVALSGIAGVSGTDTQFRWYTDQNQVVFGPLSAAGITTLDDVKGVHAVYSSIYNRYVLFAFSSNTITVIETDANTSINVLLSTTKVTIDTGLRFTDITCIKTAGNYMYVLDAFYNNLYRYNVDGILNDDVFPSQLIIDKVIGGQGSFEDKYAFNSPTSFCIANNLVYVLDAGNYTVKVYDLNLNFVSAHDLKHTLVNSNPIAIEADIASGEFIIVTTTGLTVKLSNKLQVIQVLDLKSKIGDYASIRNIFVSKSFSNNYYVVTDANIYKLYLSKPADTIGKFTLDRFSFNPETLLCVESVPQEDSSGDYVFLFTQNANATKIVSVRETQNLVSVLTLDNFEVFELSEIETQGEEYVQPWVINKAVMKMLLNHLRLKDKIKGRFTAIYDQNQVPLLAGTLYFLLDDLDMTSYSITPDHIIGNNEILTNAAVNRGLRKIYDLQISMINKSNVVVQDSGFFENQSVTLT